MKSARSMLQKYLLIPKLVLLSRSAPKHRPLAWERYWGGISTTGTGSEVLWDSGTDHEFLGYKDVLRRHLAPELPIVDVGCGHGSFTRALALAGMFPGVLGVDVSASAVARGRRESQGVAGVSYEVRDMTAPGASAGLSGGTDANVFIRGVLHVLDLEDQKALVENLRQLTGSRGAVFLAETNFQGNPMDYVTHLGATTRGIPAPLERAIRGLPMPGHFGPSERELVFPPDSWEVLAEGDVSIETNPMTDEAARSLIPGYFAVVKPRT